MSTASEKGRLTRAERALRQLISDTETDRGLWDKTMEPEELERNKNFLASLNNRLADVLSARSRLEKKK